MHAELTLRNTTIMLGPESPSAALAALRRWVGRGGFLTGNLDQLFLKLVGLSPPFRSRDGYVLGRPRRKLGGYRWLHLDDRDARGGTDSSGNEEGHERNDETDAGPGRACRSATATHTTIEITTLTSGITRRSSHHTGLRAISRSSAIFAIGIHASQSFLVFVLRAMVCSASAIYTYTAAPIIRNATRIPPASPGPKPKSRKSIDLPPVARGPISGAPRFRI